MRFILISFLFVACSNDPIMVQEFIERPDLPVEEILGAEILHTNYGNLKVRVAASSIKRFEDIQPALILKGKVRVMFYTESGNLQSKLTAEYAEIDDIKNIMIASDNVILTSEEGKKIETEELIWDENKAKIYTDQKVIITTSKEVIQGQGFESDLNFSEYSLSSIHGTFNVEMLSE